MIDWIEDANGNRCSVQYWGSKEAAQKALDSLENCKNCTNCSRCSRCSDCKNLAYVMRKENIQAIPPVEGATPARLGPPVVPIIPDIHKAVYAAASNPKALDMSNVHSCENTHCWGGWVVTLAGEAGRALEQFYNWELAAMLIYDASAPGFKMNPARFYDTNEVALADMKRLAEE